MDLYWPQAVQKALTVNGNTYVSNVQGVFYNVPQADVAAMQSAGCITHTPAWNNQPVSNYFTPPTAQTVQMYGQGSQVLTANGNTYTATAYGVFPSVLAADVSAMQGLGASTEPPYMTQLYGTQYGQG